MIHRASLKGGEFVHVSEDHYLGGTIVFVSVRPAKDSRWHSKGEAICALLLVTEGAFSACPAR